MRIRIKRVYDEASGDDGQRILVDRIWPRGLSKAKARIDHWAKEIAPSSELRRWFNHDPRRWSGFQTRYRKELDANPEAVDELKKKIERGKVTFVYAARDPQHNNAIVLAHYLSNDER